jgi:hypothetical protein
MENIMTRFASHRLLAISLLAILSAWPLAMARADTSRGEAGPGFDRVGKNIVGGMRGQRPDEADATARGARDGSPAARALAERKGELSKRMFWIMLSMR